MEMPPQGPAASEPNGETPDTSQPTPPETEATGELPVIVPPIQAPAAPVNVPPYTPPMPSAVPGATTELPVAPVSVPPFGPPAAPEAPVRPAHTPPSPFAAPTSPATPAMTPLPTSQVTPPAGAPPYRPPSAFDVPTTPQEVAKQPFAPVEAPSTPARKPKLPARVWSGVKRCLHVECLITIGIPALFAVIGILAIILWQRAAPPEGDLQPRLPQAQGPTSTSPGGAMPGTPVPGPEQGTQPGAFPGATGAPPFGTPPGQAPSGPGMAPSGPGMAPSGAAPSGVAPSGSPPSGTAPSGSSPPSGGAPSNTSVPSAPGSWPGFRGAMLDNIARDSGGLATSWGSSGPKRLWSVRLGEGYAGPAVANSRVYVLDYDDAGKRDVLRCFALATGQQVWEQSYPVDIKRNHGYSRTVPATDGRYVVSIGPKLMVLCCDAITGRLAWKMDMVSQWGATVPAWYAGQCPLIDGSKVILAPSGKAMMIAVDLASGKVLWQAPNPRGWKMTHVSIVPLTLNGKKMYVYCGSGGVLGVDASNGAILWDTDAWRVSTATVPSPVPIGDGRIFLCGGYNSGAMMIRLKPAGGQFTVEELFRLKPDVFGSEQQTPVLYQGYIYGVLPAPSKELACLDLNGKQVWRSGSTNRFGLGPYMLAGGMLYVLNENGELNLVQATPSGYKPMAKAKVLNGPEAWAPMALAGTRLLARDVTTMVCLNVGR